ncbi:hypothetical protein [Sphingomonas kyeonggiensis]|uniref:Uncharacterized protein n=1 Tax=Sphingomonas kyeonggiensis TaxID=1268553 RepID=A0A7W6JXC2_9SPHN|nr:hypothetical protein [Sphingomonas kyeonggiensis]MBB4100217.1 hypothetical protein [Sphingomonas kyeonggiensis]
MDTNCSETSEERRFFVQLVDAESGYAVHEYDCGAHDIGWICGKFSCDPADVTGVNRFELDADGIALANELFGLSIDVDYEYVDLYSWSAADGFPYRVHSNRELPLMLAGQKPLSVFIERCPATEGEVETPENLFERYVAEGILIKREYCEPIATMRPAYFGIRVVLYALKGEEWRLDAYILVRGLARKLGWSEPLTRLEGTLLGYSEWQNDAFIRSAGA